jgi:hypothetical protein
MVLPLGSPSKHLPSRTFNHGKPTVLIKLKPHPFAWQAVEILPCAKKKPAGLAGF